MDEFIKIAVTQYGPIAFGLVALLILWARIVKPALDERRVDAKSFETASENMKDAAGTSKEAASLGRDTALILKGITAKLESVTDHTGR